MPKLKIMAIGGGGISALNNLSLTKWDPVTCVAADTDLSSLEQSSAQIKIQLGKKITGGCSSCCNPKMGGLAAIDSREEIRAILAGAEMVLILTCLGGGTGTGVAPVVAEIARELECGVFVVVSTPFKFEGKRRQEQAHAGLEALRERTLSLLIIDAQNLLGTIESRASMSQVFGMLDRLMNLAATCMAGIYSPFGLVATNVSCIPKLLQSSNIIGTGFGMATGPDRAVTAWKKAILSPHLKGQTVDSSLDVFVGIAGPKDLRLIEVWELINAIQEAAGEQSQIVCAAAMDTTLGESVWITLLIIRKHT